MRLSPAEETCVPVVRPVWWGCSAVSAATVGVVLLAIAWGLSLLRGSAVLALVLLDRSSLWTASSDLDPPRSAYLTWSLGVLVLEGVALDALVRGRTLRWGAALAFFPVLSVQVLECLVMSGPDYSGDVPPVLAVIGWGALSILFASLHTQLGFRFAMFLSLAGGVLVPVGVVLMFRTSTSTLADLVLPLGVPLLGIGGAVAAMGGLVSRAQELPVAPRLPLGWQQPIVCPCCLRVFALADSPEGGAFRASSREVAPAPRAL